MHDIQLRECAPGVVLAEHLVVVMQAVGGFGGEFHHVLGEQCRWADGVEDRGFDVVVELAGFVGESVHGGEAEYVARR